MNLNGIDVFHIGLAATAYPGNFEWLDGSNNSYTNWANVSHEKFLGKSLFASVGINGWFSSDGQRRAAFICKYSPGKQ